MVGLVCNSHKTTQLCQKNDKTSRKVMSVKCHLGPARITEQFDLCCGDGGLCAYLNPHTLWDLPSDSETPDSCW